MRRRFFKKALVVMVLFLYPTCLYALNTDQFKQNFDSLGLVNLLQSRTLSKRAWSLGTGLNYSRRPNELGIIGTQNRVTSLTDHQVGMILTGAYGLNDWISLGLSLPFYPNLKFQPIQSTTNESTASIGDMSFAAKFHVWDWGNEAPDSVAMGLAVSPFLSVPSGSEEKFTGDSNVSGGFRAAYDVDLWKNRLVGNVGFRFRDREDVQNLNVGQEFLYGVGYTRPILEKWDLHVLTEIDGSVSFNGFANRENRVPLEWLVGIRKGFHESRLMATLGSAMGLTNGYGTANFRVFGMVTFEGNPLSFPKPRASRLIEKRVTYHTYAKVEGGQIVILQPIHFETAKWIIKDESLSVVQGVADLLENQPHIKRILIEGHADHRGNLAYNQMLSEQRAASVRDKLIEYGVSPDRLVPVGRGESQPVSGSQGQEGISGDRRVEFHIVEIQKLEQKEEVTEKKEEIIRH